MGMKSAEKLSSGQGKKKSHQHEGFHSYSVPRASTRHDTDVVREEKLLAGEKMEDTASLNPPLHHSMIINNQALQRSFVWKARKH